ncbi:Oxidoreductase [Actinidia chinensis var. chinensis]|uniref:Oxidoreductase n=1 Tax=Actinidia chinensis var. chinensis TaxID=1590841 RepID=A0A2R6PAB2_ACTCC|nr:Oxidoreductase [Actinidia chinensis var. chinensis]
MLVTSPFLISVPSLGQIRHTGTSTVISIRSSSSSHQHQHQHQHQHRPWKTIQRKRVVVCGRGVIGVCTAYFLAKKGAAVTLLEQSSVASPRRENPAASSPSTGATEGSSPPSPTPASIFTVPSPKTSTAPNPTATAPSSPSASPSPNLESPTATKTLSQHSLIGSTAQRETLESSGPPRPPRKFTPNCSLGLCCPRRWRTAAWRWLSVNWRAWRVYGLKAHSVVVEPKEAGAISPHALFLSYKTAQGGEAMDPEVYPRPTGEVYICRMLAQVEVGEATVKVEQACFLPCTEDSVPVIGEVPGVKVCYVATGHSCWGILNGPATGAAVAELVLDGRSSIVDLSPFSPARFIGGR